MSGVPVKRVLVIGREVHTEFADGQRMTDEHESPEVAQAYAGMLRRLSEHFHGGKPWNETANLA